MRGCLCLALWLLAAPSCAMFTAAKESAKEVGGMALESLWSWLGALAGLWVSGGTSLGVALGALFGWLVGDGVKARRENAELEDQNAALQTELDGGETTGWDAVVAWATSLGAAAWPLAIGVVAVVALLIWRGWSTSRRLKRLECKR